MILILDPSESGRIKVRPKMDGQEDMKVAGQILKLNKRDHKLPFGQQLFLMYNFSIIFTIIN